MKDFQLSHFLKNLSHQPGVYRMLDAAGKIIYVGKAKNLKRRVSSYFHKHHTEAKTNLLLQHIASIEVTITASESEALILENQLIKTHMPRYNVFLRDDKSYPYLLLSTQAEFPRLDIHRGAKNKMGRYFGPYPNVSSVREALNLLQKLFLLRQCSDHFFKLRTRPCLQYQIKRCSAPCVGYIDADQYQQNVKFAEMFLDGKDTAVITALVEKMQQFSSEQNYELAAVYRDQIVKLRQLKQQHVVSDQQDDIDVVAAIMQHGVLCITLLFIRSGQVLGNKEYFPKLPAATDLTESLSAFLSQYYFNHDCLHGLPDEIIINLDLEDADFLESAFAAIYHKKILIKSQLRGIRKKWLAMAINNAKHMLSSHISHQLTFLQRFETLQKALKIPNLPQRIECFDVSHLQGNATVAACVVMTTDGLQNREYRRFNIKNITAGDDYAALKQALSRHYAKIKTDDLALPDILLIDGGKGQLKIASEVFEALQISGAILLGIAKGEGRKPGLERIFMQDGSVLALNQAPQALHLLMQVRDEAHRFAITGHQKQRSKALLTSQLEQIPGIGKIRRQKLLTYFGGFKAVQQAKLEELAQVPGISKIIAQQIYQALHEE